MHIPTELPNCVLRPWCAADKASLLRHADNRKIWRNLTERFPHPYTEADADDWLRIAALPGPSVHLAIDVGGEAIGGIGTIARTDIYRHTGDFGYWLGELHWGRGIATAAARAMAAHLLAAGHFVRLEAPVFAWNPASMRVLEKAGFVREGVLKRSVFKDNQFTDGVMYARVRGDA
jgi:RimJ/RimL family protein N-acetyltransferase